VGRDHVIVLDTHVFIWLLADPTRIPKKASRAIKAAQRLGLADISLWEFSMLVERKKIEIDRQPRRWLDEALADERFVVLPSSPEIAVRSASLGAHFHGDPADRLVVATAVVEQVPLITADYKIQEWGGVQVIWD